MAKNNDTPTAPERRATWKSDLKLRLEQQRKRDEVLDAGMDSWDWLKGHLRWIFPVAAIVLVVWLGSNFWKSQTAGSRAQSEKYLTEATRGMQSMGSVEERAPEVNRALEELIRVHSGSRAARYGRVLKGDVAVEMASASEAERETRLREALDMYESAIRQVKAREEQQRIRLSIAKVYESLGDFEKAVETYRMNLQPGPASVWADTTRFFLGCALEKTGHVQEAIETLKTIDEDSAWYVEAKQRLDWIQAPVASASDAGTSS